MKGIEEKQIEGYLSAAKLGAALDISRSTLNRLVAKGLPHIWIGAVRRFPIRDVIEWLKQTENKG